MGTLLTRDDVAELLTMERAIDSVESALQSMESYRVPERTQMKDIGPDGEVFVMPGHSERDAIIGVKVANVFPENESQGLPGTLGSIQLFDGETGALEAILDGTRITNYRTGAIGGVAARYLAPSHSTTVGIYGSSTQARHQAIALDAELDLECIRFYSRSSKKEDAVDAITPEVSARVSAAETPLDTGAEADILVAATTATSPVIPPEVIDSSNLIIGVGANDRQMRELPGEAMEAATRVFVDDYEHCLAVGDIADALEADQLSEVDILPLADLVSGSVSGRTEAEEVFVVKSVGSIAFDIHASQDVLQWSQATNSGTTVDLQGIKADY